MTKQVMFTDTDRDLVEQIIAYQKANGYPSFIAALRKLCSDALQLKKIMKS